MGEDQSRHCERVLFFYFLFFYFCELLMLNLVHSGRYVRIYVRIISSSAREDAMPVA